jgi:hypothetical protein
MIKYLALAIMLATPVSALAALTAEQELSQKCELRLQNRAKNTPGKSMYRDKRVCGCMVGEIKTLAKGKKLQDVADFYTEKYETVPQKVDATTISVPRIAMQCLTKFYKRAEIIAENKKILAANKAFIEKQKARQAQMRAKANSNATPIPAKAIDNKNKK